MNSEELEQSLRTEFESYLNSVLADMKQDVTEFRNKIEAELEKQRSQVDEAFTGFAARFASSNQFDTGFRESVAEHLKLARDEGAKLSANAFAEAEKLDAPAAAVADFGGIRDAVADISKKDSQSGILKALVEHASAFAPRGAFFVIKNEHFVGWKVLGNEAAASESAVRDIHFPTSADSILGQASRSIATVSASNGTHAQDALFLGPLNFGQPDKMYAVPLVARGRGVAVMYADCGNDSLPVNLDALETLVSVAGMTIEMLALSQTAKAENREISSPDLGNTAAAEPVPTSGASFKDSIDSTPSTQRANDTDASQFAFSDSMAVQGGFKTEPALGRPSFEPVERVSEDPPNVEEPVQSFEPSSSSMVFESGGSIEPAVPEGSPFDRAVEPFEPAGTIGGGRMTQAVEPVAEIVSTPVPQARLSDRSVDLPIEVPEDERRLHNDARRFARLLVSEIKLYNEKKVLEGRQAHDLYDRLREAIDRSREMYDKRVQPPVAARFDYFHYELLNALAEGDVQRLGGGYPGATV
ncbi:MAG: hypothetical protein ACKVQJ_13420 [Pyrinomonadaceae bacterium]